MRQGLQPRLRDGITALFALPVGPIFDLRQSPVYLEHRGSSLGGQVKVHLTIDIGRTALSPFLVELHVARLVLDASESACAFRAAADST